MSIISIENTHKVYRRLRKPPERALNGLNLEVPEGGVFGFLGPNGSGKTTTVRLLLGLIRPTSGTLQVLGQPTPSRLPATLPQIGSLVELPTVFPAFSGRENLRLLARANSISWSRVDECLEIVGLASRAGDKVRGYSLGMRQRLGIAAALLKRPRLLILDEPTNGLDPAGIAEVRDLICSLGQDGHTTVFLSSHLLGEVQHTCDRVAILNRGQCVASGLVSEVLAASGPTQVRVRVSAEERERALGVLTTAGLSSTPDPKDALALTVQGGADPSVITRTLAAQGVYLSELTPLRADLEAFYLQVTSDGPPEPAPAAPAPTTPATDEEHSA